MKLSAYRIMLNESRQLPVVKDYDVLVCGGGFAGIASALAAARGGKKVLLLEKLYLLGGLGTAGVVTIYLPLCDGMGRQVSFGIAEELLRLSIRHGAEAIYPANWLDGKGTRTESDPRFEVQYNAALCSVLAEQALKEAGADILYGVYAVGVQTEGDRITHVITEGKSGRRAYEVQSVIDATGDCDIAWFSGAPTRELEVGNRLAAWYYSVGAGGYGLRMRSVFEQAEQDRAQGRTTTTTVGRRYLGLTDEEITEMMELSHGKLLKEVAEKRQKDESYWPVTMASMPQIRMTRMLDGEYALDCSEAHKEFSDSVGLFSHWYKRGPVFELPFRCLYSSGRKNLLTAGRCISVTQDMWDLSRVIPVCSVSGQAAGTAAAMGDDFTTLDVAALQKQLQKDGVVLHEKDL